MQQEHEIFEDTEAYFDEEQISIKCRINCQHWHLSFEWIKKLLAHDTCQRVQPPFLRWWGYGKILIDSSHPLCVGAQRFVVKTNFHARYGRWYFGSFFIDLCLIGLYEMQIPHENVPGGINLHTCFVH